MSLAVIVVTFFGVFTLVGGIIGFTKAKSKASLMAGVLSALILFFSAHGISENTKASYLMSLIVAALLGFRFFGSYFKTKRVMPDLIMIILSSTTFLIVACQMASH